MPANDADIVTLLEVFKKYLTDENFRFAVLRKEVTVLGQYLSPGQVTKLCTMKGTTILEMLKDAFLKWGADLDKAHDLKEGVITCDQFAAAVAPVAGPGVLDVAAAYGEGSRHVRCAKPGHIPLNTTTDVAIIGHGFDTNVKFQFRLGAVNKTFTPIAPISVGNDLFQHALVSVKLDTAGTWTIRAANVDDPNAGDYDGETQTIAEITVP